MSKFHLPADAVQGIYREAQANLNRLLASTSAARTAIEMDEYFGSHYVASFFDHDNDLVRRIRIQPGQPIDCDDLTSITIKRVTVVHPPEGGYTE